MCLDGFLRYELVNIVRKRKCEILTGISLVAVQVQLIRASCCLNMLVGLNSVHPSRQSASLLGIRPASVRLQNSSQSNDPRGGLNVYKGHLRAHEERSFGMCHFQQLLQGLPQFLRFLNLLLLVLLLQHTVETGHNVSVNLNAISDGYQRRDDCRLTWSAHNRQ
jgi:hypothetical protein